MKLFLLIVFAGIVVSLGQALYAMSSGKDDSGRMVRALTWRIGLSVALFALLMIGWYLGIIQPHSLT